MALRKLMANSARWVRDAWLMVGLMVLALGLCEAAARGFALFPTAPNGEKKARSAVANHDPDFWREMAGASNTRWEPYVTWRHRPRVGSYLNIDTEGRRHTWAPATLPEDAPHLWAFGGSTMLGSAARDDYTIPSMLSRALAEAGRPIHVVNFGQSAYVNTQEVLLLQNLLREGQSPDAVIFYDGANDVYAAYQAGRAGLPQNSVFLRQDYERIELGLLQRLAKRSALVRWLRRMTGDKKVSPVDAMSDGEIGALADAVIDAYLTNLGIVEALGARFGFEATFFWQPLVWSRQPAIGDEAEIAAQTPQLANLARAVYSRVAAHPELASNPRFIDLSGALDGSDQPHFFDFCHINEAGIAWIARAMHGAIEPMMGAPSRRIGQQVLKHPESPDP